MRNRFSFLLSYIFIAALAVVGVLTIMFAHREPRESVQENRILAGMPMISFETLSNGSFMSDFELWLTDGIICRAELIDASNKMLDLFAMPKDEKREAQELAAAIEEEMLGAPTQQDPNDQAEITGSDDDTDMQLPAAAGTVELKETTFWQLSNDGELDVVYRFPVENVKNAANIFNEFRAILPQDGRVIFSEVPIAATGNYYFDRRDAMEAWGSDVEEMLQACVVDGVEIINASVEILDNLEAGEFVYFRDDHHWTPLGAHQVYGAMMRQMGMNPLEYRDYSYFVQQRFEGKPLKEAPGKDQNTLEIIEPIGPVESYLIDNLTNIRPSVYMNYNSTSYMSYLGGTLGPWRLFRMGNHTGRNALLIGDSFGNALIPYLLPHYDTFLSTDMRPTYYDAKKAGASIAEYVRQYDIDDIYIMVCFATSINSWFFTGGVVNAHLHNK